MEIEKRLIELAPGAYIERDVLGIVEKIQGYDPNLKIKFLDPSRAEPGDPPYQIVEMCRDGLERIVFGVWELDDRVIERIKLADSQRVDVLARIDKQNEQARRRDQQRYRDIMGEAKEITQGILRSPKDTYTVKLPDSGKVIKFRA